MNVEIITPDSRMYSVKANVVTLPGKDGSFQVMNNHVPIIASLKEGNVKIKTPQGEESHPIKGGVVEVQKNKVIVLAD